MQQHRSRPKADLFAFAALALALAACNSRSAVVTGGHEPDGPLTTDNSLNAQAAKSADAAAAGEAGELPPVSAGPRFVGNWAADQKSCTSAAWKFTASALHSPKGISCSFGQVSDVPGGYDIQAVCSGKQQPEPMQLRFAESAKAMMVKSKSLGDTGLVFCGRDA